MVNTRRLSALAQGSSETSTRLEPPAKRVKLDKRALEGDAVDKKSTVHEETSDEPAKRIRKSKGKEKEINSSTFLERLSSPWKVGAHVSAAGGVENAVLNAAAIGANAFALFVKSQRKWTSPPLKPQSVSTFKARMKEYGYTSSVVLPHGSYLINLGNPDAEKREKSYECFLDDLKRCEELGLTMYNFHPGSSVGATSTAHSLSLISECINRAHKETSSVITVLENMAGAGNVIGGEFSHLAGIIAEVEDKTRVGVCLDTCHAFSAGYDIRTKEAWNATMTDFDSKVGLSYLRGMHLNDSKTELGSKKDRHENIGLGHLGLAAFQHILTDPRIQNVPLILETPSFEKPTEVWGEEIEVLGRLSSSLLEPSNIDETLATLADSIKSAVKVAERTAPKKVKKRKKAAVDEEDDMEEDKVGNAGTSEKEEKKTRKSDTKRTKATGKGTRKRVRETSSEKDES